MNNKEKLKQILMEVEKIRLKTEITSQKLQDYLYYQHLKVTAGDSPFMLCGICGPSKNQMTDSFKRSYKTLTDIQKAQFYLLNVKNLHSIMNSDDHKIQNCTSKSQEQAKKFKIRYKVGSMFKSEIAVSFEVLQRQKILKIIENNTELDLHNYLLRRSKNKQVPYLVLQSIQPNPLGNTIRITQNGVDFDEILNTITTLWKQAQYENIVDMLKMGRDSAALRHRFSKLSKPRSQIEELKQIDQRKTIYSSEESQSNRNNLASQKLQEKSQEDEDQLFHDIIETFVSFQKFEEVIFGEYHEKNGLRLRKMIRLSNPDLTSQKVKQLIKNIGESKKRKPHIKSISKIGQKTIYEIHEFQKNSVIFMYTRKYFTYHNSMYIVERSEPSHLNEIKMDNMIKANVHHCIWRIREIGNKVEVFVEAKIQYMKNDKNGKISRKYTNMFIGELGKLLDWKGQELIGSETDQFYNEKLSQISQLVEEQQFFTVPGSLIQDNNHEIVNNLDMEDQLVMDKSFEENPVANCQKTNESNLLNFKHIVSPSQKGQKKLMKSAKGHWLWEDEWIIKDNGDLVNVNQQKINIQSSVLKLVAKRMGRNLLSGKSILNTSLPIEIFGTDSNMQRLLRGYIFAPIFLQKAAKEDNPIERFKQVICFAVGFSLSYIIMQKPFNPILGQTYQGIIDGCPVYGEQISHHPPITSLLMLGRGYKIYGAFEAKVEMGLNTAAGINQGFNHVQFYQNEGVVKFSSPPGELSGLIYGDRKITVARKSYYIDEKNKLFCQIHWGKNKSSKNELSKYNDFFVGKIVKLKAETSLENFKNLKPTDIIQQVGEISGRLTQKVCFNNISLFDVSTEVPYQIEQYNPCLCSDSQLRKDIILRKQNQYILAQEAKEQLQIIQRRDKKLRSENH